MKTRLTDNKESGKPDNVVASNTRWIEANRQNIRDHEIQFSQDGYELN